MANGSCINYPDAPKGGASQMYKKLLKILNDRPTVNWIYAIYTSSNASQVMQKVNSRYMPNSQGENRAEDVLEFLHYYDVIEKERRDLAKAEKDLGAVDANGNRIEFTNAKDALDKAQDFNKKHTGLVSTVIQHGVNSFNIVVSEKNANTHMQAEEVEEKLKIWDVYKHAFNSIGVDIDKLPPSTSEIFNANYVDIANYLMNLQGLDFKYFGYRDSSILFNMDPNSSQVQNLVRAFGSIDNAAQALYNYNFNGVPLPQNGNNPYKLLERAIDHCKQIQGLDLQALKDQVSQMSDQVRKSSPETPIHDTLEQLNKKYGINSKEKLLLDERIESLSRATEEAIIQLERKAAALEREGNLTKAKDVDDLRARLLNEVESKAYLKNLLTYLDEARTMKESMSTAIDDAIQKITGTEVEKYFKRSKILIAFKEMIDMYYPVVDALASGKVTMDERIGSNEIDELTNLAKDIKQSFEDVKIEADKLARINMLGIITEIIGDTAPNGQQISNLIGMGQLDSSMWDWLYSAGRASNPIVGAMGAILMRAKESRSAKLRPFSEQIKRETNKLFKSKNNSEFIYEDDDVHLLSDIDWDAFENDRNKYRKNFISNNRNTLTQYDLKIAMKNWEDANTEERVVDKKTGRTERVPNSKYRKNNGLVWNSTENKMDFVGSTLTKAQQDYYNAMMQLKGEVGTLFPAYAQKQYLAPQVEKNMFDDLGDARNPIDVYKALERKFKELWKVKSDDDTYTINGMIDGIDFAYGKANYDNTPLKQIPIYYMNPKRMEKGRLLKDFSTGLQHLAATAINYNVMNEVHDTIEFMGDYIINEIPALDTLKRMEVNGDWKYKVIKPLLRAGKNTNTEAIVRGAIDHLLYDEKVRKEEGVMWRKFVGANIAYTSFKGLSTNLNGATSNVIVGEWQMMVEAGAGEFYNFADFIKANFYVFGTPGFLGEIMNLFTNNMKSKSCLLRELFDPMDEEFKDKMHERYHKSWFRQLISHDCSIIGYTVGEFFLHYINMLAVLFHEKVLLNGKETSLYNVIRKGKKQDGNYKLEIKPGVTTSDGRPITSIDDEYIQYVKNKIKYANHTTHGAMSEENKGEIQRIMLGKSAMNFRQWMIEHYSRRFRGRHFDYTLGERGEKARREGMWKSIFGAPIDDDTVELWDHGQFIKALKSLMADYKRFTLRAAVEWRRLTPMQKFNIKRVRTELGMYGLLVAFGMWVGEPDEQKKEFWRRFLMYQIKRLEMEVESTLPILPNKMLSSILKIFQSPIASTNTLNAFLYVFFTGPFNGDILKQVERGPHAGENVYLRNVRKYALPFFKDAELLEKLEDGDESIFTTFSDTPYNR